MQDYSKFGITDTNDRKKIFGLVQTIRKETTEGSMKFNMTSSASMLTSSGLRQPQTYSNTSRLPQPDFNRGRRQSVIATSNSNTNSPSSIRSPHHQFMERPTRSRTLSDAPRPDLTLRSNHNNNNSIRDRKVELRRSLYFEPENSMILEKKNNSSDDESEDEEEETTKNRKYRASAPLLDAYGVPLSPSKAARQQRNMNYYLPQSDLNQKIRVCVRKRPLNRKELERGDKDIAPNLGTRSLQINEPK